MLEHDECHVMNWRVIRYTDDVVLRYSLRDDQEPYECAAPDDVIHDVTRCCYEMMPLLMTIRRVPRAGEARWRDAQTAISDKTMSVCAR